MTVRRVVSVVLGLGLVVAACVWVSAVRFKDEASAADCGTPLSAARHGQLLPAEFARIDAGPAAGLHGVRLGGEWVTVCRGEARTRLAIAAAAIVVAVIGAALAFRRPRTGRAPPSPAVA